MVTVWKAAAGWLHCTGPKLRFVGCTATPVVPLPESAIVGGRAAQRGVPWGTEVISESWYGCTIVGENVTTGALASFAPMLNDGVTENAALPVAKETVVATLPTFVTLNCDDPVCPIDTPPNATACEVRDVLRMTPWPLMLSCTTCDESPGADVVMATVPP